MLIHRGEPTDEVSDEKMAELFRRYLVQLDAWLKTQPNIELLYVNYSEIVADPAGQIKLINQFLGNTLNADAMSRVVDSSLYRQRR
jgi:hypothetical protein